MSRVLLGPSGSGSRRSFRPTINRWSRSTACDHRVDGVPVRPRRKALAPARVRRGMVFHSFTSSPQTIHRERGAARSGSRRRLAQARKKRHVAVERVGIADQAEKYPAQLSGWQQHYGRDRRRRRYMQAPM